jgi:hypothetical protein
MRAEIKINCFKITYIDSFPKYYGVEIKKSKDELDSRTTTSSSLMGINTGSPGLLPIMPNTG